MNPITRKAFLKVYLFIYLFTNIKVMHSISISHPFLHPLTQWLTKNVNLRMLVRLQYAAATKWTYFIAMQINFKRCVWNRHFSFASIQRIYTVFGHSNFCFAQISLSLTETKLPICILIHLLTWDLSVAKSYNLIHFK